MRLPAAPRYPISGSRRQSLPVPASTRPWRWRVYGRRSMASSVSSASGSDGGATITANGSTVLPATNCSWEQVYDDDECVIEPRSCYDCLNTALASGEVGLHVRQFDCLGDGCMVVDSDAVR